MSQDENQWMMSGENGKSGYLDWQVELQPGFWVRILVNKAVTSQRRLYLEYLYNHHQQREYEGGQEVMVSDV